MPTREEIAAGLREAALTERSLALGAKSGVLPARFYGECMDNANKFEQRAAQVEGMRCDSCVSYDIVHGWCNAFDLAIGKDFGCFYHEPRDKE